MVSSFCRKIAYISLLTTCCEAFVAPCPVANGSSDARNLRRSYGPNPISRPSLPTSHVGAPHAASKPLQDTEIHAERAARGAGFHTRRRTLGVVKAIAGGGSESSDDTKDLTGRRRAIFLAIHVLLLAYAASSYFSIPGWPVPAPDNAKDLEIALRVMVDGERSVYSPVFNALGLLPAMYLSILVGGGAFRKGRQGLPPQPFVFASFFLGFFALGPYLAFRNHTPIGDGEEPGLLEVLTTNKILAVGLLGGALYQIYNFIVALGDPAGFANFAEMFRTSALVHVSTLDFIILSLAMVDPLREDMRRRGWKPDPARVALFSVPVVGPALWLVVRPAVQAGANAKA